MLQDLVARAADGKRIVFVGRQPYREIGGIVAGALGGMVPSHARQTSGLYPLKVFETLACGVPVVVTDFPGQADLVREVGCGLIVPPGDPTSLAEAVANLHRGPERRRAMGRRGRVALERDHSWTARAAATAALLERISTSRL